MANVLYGGGVADMRGSEGGTTHSRNRGGSYTRQRVTPINPNSVRQQSVRGNLTELSTVWGTVLTQAQRDAWTAWANAWPITGAFGATIVLTGLQAFVRQNTALMQAGISRMDDAPADNDVEQLLTFALAVDVSDGDMDVTFTPTPLGATSRLQLFATPAMSAGISFVKNRLRLISTQAAATASPLEVAAEWQAVFGTFPAVGQKVVFSGRIINDSNGTTSTPLEASAIVVA